MSAAAPDWRIFVAAALYSAGAHGIMTLNDFKSIEGDKQVGVNSLPVLLGAERAGLVACIFMAVPQAAMVAFLFAWGFPWHGGAVLALLLVQFACMAKMLTNPKELAPWYNGTGVMLFVIGMQVTAWAIRSLIAGG